MKQKQSKIFDLEQVGYKDLDDKYIKISFPKKDFANALYSKATSIEIDEFARRIHKEGKSALSDSLVNELVQLIPGMYQHRVAQALIDYINTFKTNKNEQSDN